MKIVVVSPSNVPDLTANSMQTVKVCHALRQLGHYVTLLVPRPRKNSPIAESPEQIASRYGIKDKFAIEYVHTPVRRLFPLLALRRSQQLKPDLIYTWVVQTAVLAGIAKIPAIFEIHELPSGRFGPWWYRALATAPGRRRIVPITRSLQNLLIEKMPAFAKLDTVIGPMGVELESFSQDFGTPSRVRQWLGFADLPTALCSGHLYAGRGVELVIELAQRMPDVQFVWVGGRDEELAFWRTKAHNQPNLIFTGFMRNSDLPQHQAIAEVLLMPYGTSISGSSGGNTASVASPMKMFEYLASGRAILASDLPVFREVLNEQNAVFCPPEDADAWENTLSNLLIDAPRRAALGKQAQLDAQKYSWRERSQRILEGFPQ
jgi:glycosyltransferase involved in cell wall biosynthesis